MMEIAAIGLGNVVGILAFLAVLKLDGSVLAALVTGVSARVFVYHFLSDRSPKRG